MTPLPLELLQSPGGAPGSNATPASGLGLTTLSARSSAYFASQSKVQEGLVHGIQPQSPPRLLGLMRRAGTSRTPSLGPAAGSPAVGSDGTPSSVVSERSSKLPRSAGLLKKVRHT